MARNATSARQAARSPSSTYSTRKAITGLMEAARRAGTMLASRAQTASARTDPPSTSGSQPLTWYNCDAIRRAQPIEAGMPISSPMRICRKAPRNTMPNHAAPVCAHRNADADLVGAPFHAVGRNSVKTHRGQHQRQDAEQSRQLRHRALLVEPVGNLLLHGPHADQREIGVDFSEGTAHLRFQPLMLPRICSTTLSIRWLRSSTICAMGVS